MLEQSYSVQAVALYVYDNTSVCMRMHGVSTTLLKKKNKFQSFGFVVIIKQVLIILIVVLVECLNESSTKAISCDIDYECAWLVVRIFDSRSQGC